jgi:competence protein ComEA
LAVLNNIVNNGKCAAKILLLHNDYAFKLKKRKQTMKRLLLLLLASFFMTSMVFATININTASESELETLDGIGPTRARAIVDYRKQHGAFRSTEELKNVPGIKEAVYIKIKEDVAISGVNIPPARKEGTLHRAGRAVNKAAAATKEKTSKAVKSSAESIENTAHAVKKKAAHSEAVAADKKEKNR